MGALMGRVLDDEMWARGRCGGRMSYSISLTGTANKSLENTHGEPRLKFILLPCGGRRGRGV